VPAVSVPAVGIGREARGAGGREAAAVVAAHALDAEPGARAHGGPGARIA
jgi:hypothetical protein